MTPLRAATQRFMARETRADRHLWRSLMLTGLVIAFAVGWHAVYILMR